MAGRHTDISGAHHGAAITPSDATIIPMTRAVYVGVTGNITCRMASGATVLFSNVPVGVFPIQVDQVHSTNTTATTMIAMY